MNQYSPKNQLFLTAQAAERGMPPITDVRSCKAWNAAGSSPAAPPTRSHTK